MDAVNLGLYFIGTFSVKLKTQDFFQNKKNPKNSRYVPSLTIISVNLDVEEFFLNTTC